MDTPRNDGGERALTRLPIQLRNKPRVRALATSFATEAQEADAGLYTLWTGRLLATSTGNMLDVYGRLVGEDRLGRDDDAYRVAIQARQLLNRSSGTAPELLRLLRLLAPLPLSVALEEHYPMGVLLRVANGALSHPATVNGVMQTAKAGGVRLHLVHQDGADAERFTTEGGVGLGFAGNDADAVGAREDVQPLGTRLVEVVVPASLGPTEEYTPPLSGAQSPVLSLTGGVVPRAGVVVVEVLDPSPDYIFQWYWEDTGTGGVGVFMFQSQAPNGDWLPVELVDDGTGQPIGVQVLWGDGEPYESGDSWIAAVTPATTAIVAVQEASTPPTLAQVAPLAFTGRVRVEVVDGTPGYTFSYSVAGAPTRTVSMARGTAVPLLLADDSPSGVEVTWEAVDTHYPGARWVWQAVAANPVVGGRLVSVRG